MFFGPGTQEKNEGFPPTLHSNPLAVQHDGDDLTEPFVDHAASHVLARTHMQARPLASREGSRVTLASVNRDLLDAVLVDFYEPIRAAACDKTLDCLVNGLPSSDIDSPATHTAAESSRTSTIPYDEVAAFPNHPHVFGLDDWETLLLLPAKEEQMSRPTVIRNRLLALLPKAELNLIALHLQAVDLSVGTVLKRPGEVQRFGYFLESGLGSVTVVSSLQPNGQVGHFGREGMTPVAAIHRASSDVYLTVMQVASTGFRIAIDVLHRLMTENVLLQTQLGHYAHTVAAQSAHAVFSLSAHSVEPRIARLLLMFHDRIDGNELILTHLSISRMLSVPRPTTTRVIQSFRMTRLIDATRSKLTVLDRVGLEEIAGKSYGAPEREYRRLIGLTR